jgi:hypothetical protein
MREVTKITVSDTLPDQQDVMVLQGIPLDRKPPDNAILLFQEAIKIYEKFVRPAGIVADISRKEFAAVYKGESSNEPETPLPQICEKANKLALFAVTIGELVHGKIGELFEHNEFALGSILDSVASAGVEKAADTVGKRFLESLRHQGVVNQDTVVLRYSPGYCGWHVSGQKKLFEFLKPNQIGIRLRASFLMEPLKSVSGVLVAGKKEIHIIEAKYPFCGQCDTHSCQERVRALMITPDISGTNTVLGKGRAQEI